MSIHILTRPIFYFLCSFFFYLSLSFCCKYSVSSSFASCFSSSSDCSYSCLKNAKVLIWVPCNARMQDFRHSFSSPDT